MKNFIIFALGVATGAVLGWKIAKKDECDDMSQNEPENNEEKTEVETEENEETKTEIEKEDEPKGDKKKESRLESLVHEAETIIKENKYRNYSSSSRKIKEKVHDDRPYVIPPNEFGELDDYETTTLIYYAEDNVLTCDDNIVDNVDDIVGEESLTHFGEYEKDTVCVRNDTLKSDYEILRDEGSYDDVLKNKPYLRGGTNNGR